MSVLRGKMRPAGEKIQDSGAAGSAEPEAFNGKEYEDLEGRTE